MIDLVLDWCEHCDSLNHVVANSFEYRIYKLALSFYVYPIALIMSTWVFSAIAMGLEQLLHNGHWPNMVGANRPILWPCLFVGFLWSFAIAYYIALCWIRPTHIFVVLTALVMTIYLSGLFQIHLYRRVRRHFRGLPQQMQNAPGFCALVVYPLFAICHWAISVISLTHQQQ